MHELITAIAALLWPLITLTAILVFRRAIGRVLRTAEKRELEFEVGGQRLTFHELNDQQNEMIQDLQRQLSVVSRTLDERERAEVAAEGVTLPDGDEDGGAGAHGDDEADSTDGRVPRRPGPAGYEPNGDGSDKAAPGRGSTQGTRSPTTTPVAEPAELPAVRAPAGPEPFAVLWVAERPETHALLVEQLRDNGVRVTTVATTSTAVSELAERPYRLIVSDMSRTEDGHRRSDAGLFLLQELRDLGVDIPVVVFSGQRGRLQHGEQARRLGAVATTSSAYEMFRHFQNFGLL